MATIDVNDEAVVVIGSGAGGATIAHELCMRGINVVLLEAGKRIEATDFIQDDLAAFGQLSWLDPRVATGDWDAARYAPTNPSWTVKAVGGSTVHWNGLAFRMQRHEFRPRETYGAIAGADLIDWPITLDDLAPYYDRAEDKMGVTGTHDIKAHPASNNYKVLHAAARAIGYKNISNTRMAINSDVRDDRPGCVQLGFCNQGCKMTAKWSSLYAEIPKAEETGRLDLRTQAMAVRIEHDAAGKASGVVYVDAKGQTQRQRARVVCVAASGVETPRLLLLSESSLFPQGLANGSGLVGRNYMRHIQAVAFAAFPKPVNMHRGITTAGVVYDEARHDPTRAFASGYLFEAVSMGPPSIALILQPGGWGADYAGFIERYDHLAGVLMNGEELPSPDNRVKLHASVKDRFGLPVAHVHVDEHPMSKAMRPHFFQQSDQMYRAIGATDVRIGTPPSAAHQMGTCRMSTDPAKGVVNSFGQTHEVANLFLSDGSVMPSSSAENPTLTIVALAIRQAEHIATRLKNGEL